MSTCFSSVWSIARSGIAASHGNPMLNFVRDCQINFHEKIILFKLYFIIYAITVVPVFSPLPTSTQPTPATPSCNPYILSMSIGHTYVFSGYLLPSPFIWFPLPPTSPPTAVSLFHVSVPLFLFCSLVYFVHQVPRKIII